MAEFLIDGVDEIEEPENVPEEDQGLIHHRHKQHSSPWLHRLVLPFGCLVLLALFMKPPTVQMEETETEGEFEGNLELPVTNLAGVSQCLSNPRQECLAATYVNLWPTKITTHCKDNEYAAIYNDITIYDRNYLSLVVTDTNYSSDFCPFNGFNGPFGTVALDRGEKVDLLYRLVDSTDLAQDKVTEVVVDTFLMSWFGFSKCMDVLICGLSKGYMQIYTPAGSDVGVKPFGDDCALVRTSNDVPVDTPEDPMELTDQQADATIVVTFHQMSGWTMNFTGRDDPTCPTYQNIMFSGMSSVMDCYQPAMGSQGEDNQETSTLTPFNCVSGELDAEPIQALCYNDYCAFKILDLQSGNGDYTDFCTLPKDGSTFINGGLIAPPKNKFGTINACGLNPIDNFAYCRIDIDVAGVINQYLTRIGRNCGMELLAKMPLEKVASATFTLDGTFWTDTFQSPLQLYKYGDVHRLYGFNDVNAIGLPDLSGTPGVPYPNCLTSEYDVAGVKADLDKDGYDSEYLIFLERGAKKLHILDVSSDECKNFDTYGYNGVNKEQFGAAWSYSGEIYFSGNSGTGVYQVNLDTLDWNDPGSQVELTFVTASEPTNKNDGLNCMEVASPIPTGTSTSSQTVTSSTATTQTLTLTSTTPTSTISSTISTTTITSITRTTSSVSTTTGTTTISSTTTVTTTSITSTTSSVSTTISTTTISTTTISTTTISTTTMTSTITDTTLTSSETSTITDTSTTTVSSTITTTTTITSTVTSTTTVTITSTTSLTSSSSTTITSTTITTTTTITSTITSTISTTTITSTTSLTSSSSTTVSTTGTSTTGTTSTTTITSSITTSTITSTTTATMSSTTTTTFTGEWPAVCTAVFVSEDTTTTTTKHKFPWPWVHNRRRRDIGLDIGLPIGLGVPIALGLGLGLGLGLENGTNTSTTPWYDESRFMAQQGFLSH